MDISESLGRLPPPYNSFASKLQSIAVSANVAQRSTSRKALEAFIERLDSDFDGFKEYLRGRMEEVRRLVAEDERDLALYLSLQLRTMEAFCRLYVEGLRKITNLAEPTDGSLSGLSFLVHIRGTRVQNRFLTESREIALRLNMALFPPSVRDVQPSTCFERCSRKFWLPPEELFNLQVVCGTHLPLDIFLASANADRVRVSSIYFDTPQFGHYKDRVKQQEGSTLIRLRAYGLCPTEVWVEIKTHHESWVQDQSMKQRFKIPLSKLRDYLRGILPVDTLLTEPTEEMIAISTKIQDQISRRLLIPTVRTDYYRSAYQSDATSGKFVRVTIDSNFSVVDLRGYNVEEALTVFSNPDPTKEKISSFPFAVVETKIHGEAGSDVVHPPWLDDVMSLAMVADLFSKYQLGVATFVPHNTISLPTWWNYYLQAHSCRKKEIDSKVIIAPIWNPDRGVTSMVQRNQEERTEHSSEPVSFPSSTGGLAASIRMPQFIIPTALPQAAGAGVSLKIEPKTHFANERTFIQWHSAALFLCTVAKLTGRSFWQYQWFPVVEMLFAMALLIMFYSLWRYHWRRRALLQRDTQRFDDPFGPTVMTCALAIAICVLISESSHAVGRTVLDVTSSANSLGPKQWSHLVDGSVQGVVYRKAKNIVYIAYHDTPMLYLGFFAVPWVNSQSYLAKFDTQSGFMQKMEITHLIPACVGALDWVEDHFMVGSADGSIVELKDPFLDDTKLSEAQETKEPELPGAEESEEPRKPPEEHPAHSSMSSELIMEA